MKPAASRRPVCGIGDHSQSRLGLALVGVWAIVALPVLGLPLAPGVDGSFAFGLNALHSGHLVHGRDATFPFGPLGYLVAPQPLGDNLATARLWLCGLHLLQALACALLAWRGLSVPRLALLLAVLWLLPALAAPTEEYRSVWIVALLLAPALAGERPGPLASPLAAALGLATIFVKVSAGLVALALVAGYSVLLLRRRPAGWRLELGAIAGATCAALLLAVPLLFQGPAHFGTWLVATAELAGGFGAAMGQPGDAGVLAVGVAAAAALVVLGLAAWRRGWSTAPFWLAGMVPAALVFKHGFVRQDAHVWFFFVFLGLWSTLGWALAREREERRVASVLLLAVALALLGVGRDVAPSGIGPWRRIASGRQTLEAWRAVVALSAREAALRTASRALLAPARLPEPVANELREAGRTYDGFPWDLTPVAANGLAWRPQPLLQLYAAFTPRLDRASADHFAGPLAPDRLLLHLRPIDDRGYLWDAPLTWRAVLAAYRRLDTPALPGLAVLERRGAVLRWQLAETGRASLTADRWYEVPAVPAGEWPFVALDLVPTPRGRLQATLFRLPPVWLEVELADGERRRLRVVPATAEAGLAMVAPRDLEELAALFTDRPPAPLRRFRLLAEGLQPFRQPVTARFLVGHRRVATEGDPAYVGAIHAPRADTARELNPRADARSGAPGRG